LEFLDDCLSIPKVSDKNWFYNRGEYLLGGNMNQSLLSSKRCCSSARFHVPFFQVWMINLTYTRSDVYLLVADLEMFVDGREDESTEKNAVE